MTTHPSSVAIRVPSRSRHWTVASALQDDERDFAFSGETLRFELVIKAPLRSRRASVTTGPPSATSARRQHGDRIPSDAGAAASAGEKGGGSSAAEAEVELQLKQFKDRFSAMTASISLTSTQSSSSRASHAASQYERTRMHACSVSTLGCSDPTTSRRMVDPIVQLANGDLVFDLVTELSNIPLSATSVTITATVSELLSNNNSGSASAADAEDPYSGTVTRTLQLCKPPHVFCSTTDVAAAKLVSVQVHNHLHLPVTLIDIQLYLSTVQPRNNSIETDGASSAVASAATTRAKFLRNQTADIYMEYKRPKAAAEAAATATAAPSTAAARNANDQKGLNAHRLLQVVPLSASMPEDISPASRHAFIFSVAPVDVVPGVSSGNGGGGGGGGSTAASRESVPFSLQPTPAATSQPGRAVPMTATESASAAAAGQGVDTSDALSWAASSMVSITWKTEGLISPIACQYELVRMVSRVITFHLSASHTGPVQCGEDFEVTYTLNNMTTDGFDLTLAIGSPRLADHLPGDVPGWADSVATATDTASASGALRSAAARPYSMATTPSSALAGSSSSSSSSSASARGGGGGASAVPAVTAAKVQQHRQPQQSEPGSAVKRVASDEPSPPKNKNTSSLFVNSRTLAKHRAMQARAVSGMAQLDSGTRLHIQALAEFEASQPGLVSLQEHIHVGKCPPNSSVTARARFYAYQPGVYEIGNVKLRDALGGIIRMKPIRHSVYVHA